MRISSSYVFLLYENDAKDIDELVEELELELLLIVELVELFELVDVCVINEGDDDTGSNWGVSCC